MLTLGTIGLFILAAAPTGTATTVAIPVWVTFLFGVGGPVATVVGVLGLILVHRAKIKEIETKADTDAATRIDGKITRLHKKLTDQIEDMDERIKTQSNTIVRLEQRVHRTEDYAEALRAHISAGNPPPPPAWPDFNGSHASTSEAPKTD